MEQLTSWSDKLALLFEEIICFLLSTPQPELLHCVVLSSFLFFIGLCGIIINKNNLIAILMSIELMLLGTSINFTSFSLFLNDIAGQIFVIFILTVAAAEAAIGLAILVIYFRKEKNIDTNTMVKLRR